MSAPHADYEAELVDEPAPRRSSASAKWWRWGTVGLIAAMVVGPLMARQLPREVANWHAAAAVESRLDGHDDQAREQLEAALGWDARNPAFYLQRAQWNREDRRYDDALADCNKARELAEWHPMVLMERSQVYQHMKRYEDAVDDWKAIAEMNERRPVLSEVSIWNGLAYARAVAGVDLEAALADADRAAKREPAEVAILDTRGFLLFKLGRYDDALKDLDVAVKGAETRLADRLKKLDVTSSTVVDRRQSERERKAAETEFAVILYHRSLILDKLDQPEAAAADRDRIRQLGLVPGDDLF